VEDLYGKDAVDYVSYMDRVHHGMPDFVCYHPQLKEFKFVECKFGHEQLSKRQVLTLQKLMDRGFSIEVHKLVGPCTKNRKIRVDLYTKKKKVLEKELTLGLFIKKSYKTSITH